MNLKEIKKRIVLSKFGKRVGNCYKNHYVRKNGRFKRVRIKSNPDIYYLRIFYISHNPRTFLLIKITELTLTIVTESKGKEPIVLKEYDNDIFFNYSMDYTLPSPEELKEIRKYMRKFYKNRMIEILDYV